MPKINFDVPPASAIIRKQIKDTLLKIPVKTGDLIFRFGDARYKYFVRFSKIVCELTDPPSWRSHVAILTVKPWLGTDEIFVYDMSGKGLRLYFFIDWMQEAYLNGSIEIRRPKEQHQHKMRKLDAFLYNLWLRQPSYDFNFVFDDKKFYCAEIVDYTYRKFGFSMPDMQQLNKMPGWGWQHDFIARAGKISPSTKIVLPGDENIGLAGSEEFDLIYRNYEIQMKDK